MLIQIIVFKLEQALSDFPVFFCELVRQQFLDMQLIAIQQQGTDTTIRMQMNFSDLYFFQHLCMQRGFKLHFVDQHFARISLKTTRPNGIQKHSNN